MILKNIGILSLAKFSATVMLFIGLIIGILFGFASQIAASSFGLSQMSNTLSIWFISIIVMPIMISLISTIICVIFALIYNLFSKFLGGINLDFETQTI